VVPIHVLIKRLCTRRGNLSAVAKDNLEEIVRKFPDTAAGKEA
jgi:hypothetical protein